MAMFSYVQYINSGFPELPNNHAYNISFCIYFFLKMHNSKCHLMSFNVSIHIFLTSLPVSLVVVAHVKSPFAKLLLVAYG